MASDAYIQSSVKLLVSKDRMQAWLALVNRSKPNFTPPTAAEIDEVVLSGKIDLNPATQRRVGEFAKLCAAARAGTGESGPPELPERWLIAEGTPPVDATDGRFELDPKLQQDVASEQEESVNQYKRNSIRTMRAGTRIGVLRAPTPGVPGRNVHGDAAPPCRAHGMAIRPGHGVNVDDGDPAVVTTTVDGRIVVRSDSIHVDEVLEIRGDVNFRSGVVDCCTDVHIHGSVLPHFDVSTSKSVVVERAVEAASIDAGGDVTVRRGIFGQEREIMIRAGGTVLTTICDSAQVDAGLDIGFVREMIGSHVKAGRFIKSDTGAIVGGEVHAVRGIRVRDIGSEAGVTTIISVGPGAEVLGRIQQLGHDAQNRIIHAKKLQEGVQPLMADIKRINAAQRERVVEVLAKAADLEAEAEQMTAECDALRQKYFSSDPLFIECAGVINAGVIVRMGIRETKFERPMRGPIRITLRQDGGRQEIVAFEPNDANEVVLPSMEMDLRKQESADEHHGDSKHATQHKRLGPGRGAR